jgi:hypothetical protein
LANDCKARLQQQGIAKKNLSAVSVQTPSISSANTYYDQGGRGEIRLVGMTLNPWFDGVD